MSEEKPLRGPTSLPSPRAALGTVLRLGVACLLVGALLVIFRVDPVRFWKELFSWIQTGLVELFGTSVQGIELVFTLLATGAVIVVPIWLISKLLSVRK
ncbi:MAG: DUF6460 domain-containing protein [Pseudomonadota bacterium]